MDELSTATHVEVHTTEPNKYTREWPKYLSGKHVINI
jgi:hypothetical protein